MQRYGSTRRLGPVQSPVVSASITRRVNEARASSALKKASFSLLVSLTLLMSRYFYILAWLLSGMALILLQYAEIVAASILLLNFLYNITLYLGTYLMMERILLTSAQYKMLGIKNQTPGYDVVPSAIPFGELISSTPVSGHTSSVHSHYYMTPTHSSIHGYRTPPSNSSHSSPPSSNSTYSSHTPTPTSFHGQNNSRIYRTSPFSGEPVADTYSLQRYLQQEEDKEQRLLRGSVDMSPPQQSPSGWYGGSPHLNRTPSPRKYRIAPRSSSPSSSSHGESDSSHYKYANASLESCGIKKVDLECWTERCRKWISLSVVKPLADEISTINSTFSRKRIPEQIGTISIGSLKRIAKSKAQHLPTLSMVIPYLEVSTKQEYLVDRIKELAQGSYLSAYHWNSGGLWKGRPWSIELPNDSQIVMHLLSTYLDNHLPPDPWFPDGKTFSTQYFLKAPPKNGSKMQSVCIVQDNNNPPTYKVLVRGKYMEISEGRNSLFHSICIFLHHVKGGEKSMLGSINLETAGINILSIISSAD